MLIPLFLTAQPRLSKNFKVELGTPYPVVDADIKYQFYHNGEILMVKIEDESIQLLKFDATSLKFTGTKEYKDFPKSYIFEDIVEVADRYYFFYSYWDKPNKKERLYLREIDFSNGSFIDKGKKIVSVDGKCSGVGYSGNTTNNYGFFSIAGISKFNISSSLNSDKFMVQYRKSPENKNDSKNFDKIGTYIFDMDAKQLYGNVHKMPYTEEQMDNLDYEMDWKGNAYILARVKVKDEKGRYKIEGSHLELLLLPGESNKELRKTEITFEDKFVSDAWLFENVYGEIVTGGFYNNKKRSSSADGLFFSHVDTDGEVLSTRYFDIPLTIINQNIKRSTQSKNAKKESKGKDVGLVNYIIKQIIVNDDDGSFLVIAERDYIVSHYSSKTNRTTYTYHYEDILVTKITEEGVLSWMKKLPKLQKGTNGKGGMGYKYMSAGSNHYFVYLDNVKNLDLKHTEVPNRHMDGKGGFLVAYRLDHETGEISKDALFDLREVKGLEVYQFNVGRILMLDNSEFIVEVYKKKKQDILIKVKALN